MLQENQLFANRYRLVKRLGQGAFSEVWKAEDTLVGDLTVALKIYAPDKGLDEDGAKIFGEEFAIVFNIHHQNLLTPSTFDKERNSPYLVLPFCERGSATRLIGKADERQIAQFLHDVSSALAYLHAKNIVHQDIKPDNVLMDSDGTFLVTDFGISTRIRSTLRKTVGDKKSSGTRAYMGPERFSKTPDPIKASDVWSLGATVFELMKGDVPFGEDGGLVQKIGAETPDIPGSFSPELKQIVERCLAPDTWNRPTAAQLRDITDYYLRTGAWDLSSLNKGGTQEPEKPKAPVGRPTERKVKQNNKVFPDKPTTEGASKAQRAKPKMNKKRWIILLSGILVLSGIGVATTVIITRSTTKALAKTYTVNGVSFTMKYVEGGTFQMGATSEQGSDAFDNEKPVHSVTVSDFCMAETEVTQALWKAVMGNNPSWFKGDNRPVEEVSWNDCQAFIQKLNQLTGKTFRLPTEAEWEYAARGGNNSQHYKYAGSNTLGNVAWYDDNSGNSTHPVKGKQANELGLYDMSGNVCEWCSDQYGSDYYRDSPSVNPTGRKNNSYRVLRGGGWRDNAWGCRVANRYGGTPSHRDYNYGFRLVLVHQ